MLHPQGDTYFLFKKIPLDPLINLQDQPIEIYSGAYLVQVPYKLFDIPSDSSGMKDAKDVAFIEWSYSGYHLGLIDCNVSIQFDSSIPHNERDQCFWAFITALLLIKPLFIHILGLYSENKPSLASGKFDFRTNLSLQTSLSYNMNDIELAKQLLPIILHYKDPKNNNLRLSHIIQQFQQAFIFEKLHYASSIYSKLFPLIDSLAGNPTYDHNKYISARLGKLLANTLSHETKKPITQETITNHLSHIWGLHRYPELHGHIKETYPKPDIPNSSPNLFSDDENI